MTGNAFIKRLSFQLDFLNEDDKKTVIAFYERKLTVANTLVEEETIVKSFGSPEHIAKMLKEAYFSHLAAAEADNQKNNSVEKTTTDAEISESDVPDDKQVGEPEMNSDSLDDTEDDVIFSKPSAPKKAAEMIHSLENQEVKTLYGEKVIIEERISPIEEIIIEPIDNENGLTAEEIQQAKDETLEKANNYTTAAIELPSEFVDNNGKISESTDFTEESKIDLSEDTKIDLDRDVKVDPNEKTQIAILTDESNEIKETEFQEDTVLFIAEDNDSKNTVEEKTIEVNAVNEASSAVENIDLNEPCHEESIYDTTEDSAKDEGNTQGESDSTDTEDSFADLLEASSSELSAIAHKAGIITRIFPESMPKKLRLFFSILLSVIVSPVLLLVFGVGILSYVVSAAAVLAIALLAFALLAILVVLGVVELIYGFSSLFDIVSVALIEIGIGTAVFGIVTAVAAMIYEFLFGVVPKTIKFLTKIFVKYLKKVGSFLYGGRA